MYPLLLILEFILNPIAISLTNFGSMGLYIILVLEITITIFVCVFQLYPSKIQNVRNYVHRAIILFTIFVQIFTLKYKKDTFDQNPIVYL